MSGDYDVAIIGGGHNSLTAANYLAKAGLKVAVFERRNNLGGIAASEELIPGFSFNTGHSGIGPITKLVVEELALKSHGLEIVQSPAIAFAPELHGQGITLWRDADRTIKALKGKSASDAEAYSKFLVQVDGFSSALGEMANLAPPSLSYKPLSLLLAWIKVAFKTRRLGAKNMLEFLRVLPIDVKHFLDEQFESESLKGLLGVHGLRWLNQGPRAAGTSIMLLYQQLVAGQGEQVIRGGVGQFSKALGGAAKAKGVDIRLNTEVSQILLKDGKAVGVRLVSGEEIRARYIFSGADPAHTFLSLVGAPQLEPRVVRRFQSLKMQGATASVHLALSGLPEFPSANGDLDRLTGGIIICPSLDYAERAHDDSKYGRVSQRPILEAQIASLLDPSLAPEGQQAMSITFRFAPYRLRDTDWDSERENLGDLAVNTLAAYSPGLKDLILERAVLTPLDYERDYGLTEGSFSHGQMSLDQLLLMRPVAGFAAYRGPIENLYLCGPGTHPGGGISGLPGRNAAKQLLRKL
jgi:phytoene dehydrogenase-like protein